MHILVLLDFDKLFELNCDVVIIEVGVVLIQEGEGITSGLSK